MKNNFYDNKGLIILLIIILFAFFIGVTLYKGGTYEYDIDKEMIDIMDKLK